VGRAWDGSSRSGSARTSELNAAIKLQYRSDTLPDNFSDTIAWVHFRLIKDKAILPKDRAKEEKEIRAVFERIATRIQVSPYDLRDFRAHRDEVSQFFGWERNR
jgi:hypothetical protein